MQLILGKDETIDISASTGDVHNPTRYICQVSPLSALFTFTHGYILVQNDEVTIVPYVNGKRGTETVIKLGE